MGNTTLRRQGCDGPKYAEEEGALRYLKLEKGSLPKANSFILGKVNISLRISKLKSGKQMKARFLGTKEKMEFTRKLH